MLLFFVLEKSINDACVKEEECSATLHCDRSVCQCAASNYWTGSTCSISINLLFPHIHGCEMNLIDRTKLKHLRIK